jgi:hypothetical protein
VEAWKHGNWIFGAEVDTVHNVRIEQIFCDLLRKIRVTYEYIPFADPVEKPFAEECRDICPASGIEDHGGFTLIDVLFGRIKGMREKKTRP